MRSRNAGGWAGLLAFLVVAQPAFSDTAGQQVRVTAAVANVRSQPAPTAPVLFQAKSGEVLRLVDTKGDWMEVETSDGRRGFIFHTLVEVLPSAPQPPAAAPAAPQAAAPQSGPSIDHRPVECIVAEKYPRFEAGFQPPDVARARVYFKAEGGPHWYYVDMTPEGDRFVGTLPKPKKDTHKINYYVQGLDKTSMEGRTKDYAPDVVTDKSQCSTRMMAGLAGASKVVVGAEPGAPLVPAGFEQAGVVGASAAATGAAVAATSGGHTLLFVAGGIAAAGGIALAAKGGGAGTPTASITSVSPSGLALVAATVLTFSGAGSDSKGGTVTFTWDFGDGQTGTGQTTTHVYNQSGMFTATLSVSNGSSSAKAMASPVTTRDLTGTWSATFGNELRTSTFTLSQAGPSISGMRQRPGVPGTAMLNGSVADPRKVTITSPGFGGLEYCAFSVTGNLNDSLTQLVATGATSGPCGTLPLSLTMQRQ
jgi:hypothetical protein